MICPSCGTANPDAAGFCNKCGKPLTAAAAAAVSGAPAQPVYTGPPQSSGKATASLVLGILGMLLSWIIIGIPMAIVAIVLGHVSYSQIKNSGGRLTGQGKAIAGAVLGYLSVVTIPFILIIAAIAIPNLLRARQAANEAAAVANIRTINTAEITYLNTYRGYTCDLAALGGSGGTADAQHAQLIDPILAAGQKTGYRFELRGCEGSPPDRYQIVAVPIAPNQTGKRAFCSDSSGVIRFDPNGSAENCLTGEPLQ